MPRTQVLIWEVNIPKGLYAKDSNVIANYSGVSLLWVLALYEGKHVGGH